MFFVVALVMKKYFIFKTTFLQQNKVFVILKYLRLIFIFCDAALVQFVVEQFVARSIRRITFCRFLLVAIN